MCFRPKSIPASTARRSLTLARQPPAPDLTVDHADRLRKVVAEMAQQRDAALAKLRTAGWAP